MSQTIPSTNDPGSSPESKIREAGPIVITVLVMTTFLASIALAAFYHDQSLELLLGAAAANATTAVGYWLGSSSGSKGKDQALTAAVVTAASQQSQQHPTNPQPGTLPS